MELLELLQDCYYGTKLEIKRKSKTINTEKKRTTAIRWERSSTCRDCLSLWEHGVWSLLIPQTTKLSVLVMRCGKHGVFSFPWDLRSVDEEGHSSKDFKTAADRDNPPATILTLASMCRLVEAPTSCRDVLLVQSFAANPGQRRSQSPAWLGLGSAVVRGNYCLAPETSIFAKPQGGSEHQST